MFTLSVKCEIRHFLVLVVQKQQRNVQKKCDTIAKLLFCLFNPIVFFFVRCCRQLDSSHSPWRPKTTSKPLQTEVVIETFITINKYLSLRKIHELTDGQKTSREYALSYIYTSKQKVSVIKTKTSFLKMRPKCFHTVAYSKIPVFCPGLQACSASEVQI